jgi:D-aminopeptidase
VLYTVKSGKEATVYCCAAHPRSETDLLAPEYTVEHVDAIVLSGGSAFGLAAADGVRDFLREQGRGFSVTQSRVPIVPAAILFDLAGGREQKWRGEPPYRLLGRKAAQAAANRFAIGSAGAGAGATTFDLKGGLGSASWRNGAGYTVAALVAVNACGTATIGGTPHFWAAPFEKDREFGGLGLPQNWPDEATRARMKGAVSGNTTIAIIATDAALTPGQAKRFASSAHDGLARALYPAHTPMDGDLVFAISTGARTLNCGTADLAALCVEGANCLARAIARGVYEASPGGPKPAWREKFLQG